MVLYFHNAHVFPHDFATVTLAYFNRYPNPYSAHVKSTDTVSKHIDDQGRLHQTKVVMKSGRLPNWVKPFLGKITTSWIVERSIVDPAAQTMKTYCCNLDHTKIIRVEEFNEYTYDPKTNTTNSKVTVRFSSGLTQRFAGSIRNKIEIWSKDKFRDNLHNSRIGFMLVMDKVKARLDGAAL